MPTAIQLAVTWAALELTYLLGDVLRLYAGHFVPGSEPDQRMWLAAAGLMVTPIVMLLVSVLVPGGGWVRWVHVVVACLLAAINLVGIASYEGWYDRILIGFSILVNALTVWLAVRWTNGL